VAFRDPNSLTATWLTLFILALGVSACAGALPQATQPVGTVTPSEVPITESPTSVASPTTSPLPSPTLTPTLTPTPTPFIYAYGPDNFPLGVNPLTGLQVADPSLLERRPIVIKVTNFPRSVRPQWGLSLADHVYEYYIADNFSRFVGVFLGKDATQVGPIRSARLFDARVTRMYNGIFIFGWADDPVLNFLFAPDIKPHLIVERPDDCPPLCRIGSDKKTEYNNLFADTTAIASYLKKRRTNNDPQDVSGLRFEEIVPPSGNPSDLISIQYSLISYHRWKYDPQVSRYFRYQETGKDHGGEGEYAPLLDSLTQEQISADNVIVIFTPHQFFKKSSSTEIIDQPFIGQGPGYAFRDGQVYPLTWKRAEADHLPDLLLPGGNLYPLKPGNTWFEIIGKSSQFEQLDNGSWSFVFSMP
jgi:hypothetical protein